MLPEAHMKRALTLLAAPTPADAGWWRGNRQIVYVLERRETVPE